MPFAGEEIGGEHRRGVPRHGGVENGGSEGLEKAVRSSLDQSINFAMRGEYSSVNLCNVFGIERACIATDAKMRNRARVPREELKQNVARHIDVR